MASLRKRFSKWSLGEQQLRPSNDYVSTDDQISLDQSPRRLHKALSTTFNYMATTVRRGTTYIYQEKDDNPQRPVTPSKYRRRTSLFASVSSRKGIFSPREQLGEVRSRERIPARTSESSEGALSPVRSRRSSQCSTLVFVNDGKAPTLDVKIPDSSWSVGMITGTQSTSVITALQSSPISEGSDNGLFMQDPFIDRDALSSQVHDPMTPELPRLRSYGKTLYVEDTGSIAESESGSEQSEAAERSSARLRGVGLGSPETEASKPCDYPRLASFVQPRHQSESPKPNPSRGSSATTTKPAKRPSLSITQSQQSQTQRHWPLPSDVYEADGEMSETSAEIAPSMGSRTNFEHGLADRSRRYLAAIGQNSDSNGDKLIDHQLSKSTMAAPHCVEDQQVTSFSPLETPKAQLPSLMLSMRLTEDDLMALGEGDIEGRDVLQVVSTSDTDISDCSPCKKAVLTQEDAYGAGIRAAGILRPSYLRQLSPTSWKHVGLDRSSPQSNAPTSTPPKSLQRSSSSRSDATSDNCAITTRSPACNVSPPFPTLHIRSEPTSQCVADASALNTTENDEIPITGPANLGFDPLPLVNLEDKVPADTAKLPNFGPPNTGIGPKSRRALRRQKKINKMAAFARPAPCDTTKRTSSAKQDDQTQFSVQQFLTSHGKPSTYLGHELEAIHNDTHRAGNCPQGREVKVVSFAEKEEIIGRSVIVRRLSPGRSPQ